MKKISQNVLKPVEQKSDTAESGDFVDTGIKIEQKPELPFCCHFRVDNENGISTKINELREQGYTEFQVVPSNAGRFVIIAFLK